ncbi:hypothetical protein [Algoriphagus mannitolivorans]|uniref:hypothetical protein n=1 Tax=Algoriphagus mannitolivorans TaxID=226504 RepID=UPI000426973F|nr:hypothetical protein [Algoriphagus mannitolivorans]
MKSLFTFLLVSLMAFQAFSQEEKLPSQSLFLELGGAGLPYSFNYDFRFDKTKMDSWGMRIGLGGYSTRNESFFSMPIMVNKLYGQGPHYFEMGMGFTFFAFNEDRYSYCQNGYYDQNNNFVCTSYYTSSYSYILDVDGSPSVMGTLNFGYRKVPVDGGVTWRLNLAPIFNNNGFWPLYIGAGLGYAF